MAVTDIFPALFDNYFIKVIFLIHATLLPLATIASFDNRSLITYTFYNSLFLFAVLLAILVDKNADIVLVATAFNVISIGLDILLLIFGYYLGLMATLLVVVNLIFRPLSTILLLRNYSARAGVDDPTSGLLEVSVHSSAIPQPRTAYHNIDEPNQSLP